MNYSWIAYENALRELPKHIPPEYAGHEKVRHLQSELMQNIAQARRQCDTPELRSRRKDCVVEMDNIMRQATKVSFIELCISMNPALRYLTDVDQVARQACMLFSEEEIWIEPYQRIVQQFHQKLVPEDSIRDRSNITVDLYYINNCANQLIKPIEDFKEYCLPNGKSSDRSRDKQTKIHEQLKQFVEKVRRISKSYFEEFIYIRQEMTEDSNTVQPYPILSTQPLSQVRCIHISSSADDVTERNTPSSKAQTDTNEPEKQHQSINQRSEHRDGEGLAIINRTTLREAIVKAFGREDLSILCADIRQALSSNGIIDEAINLESLGGEGIRGKVQNLIEYCDRRGWLAYLLQEVQNARPNLKF